MKAAGSGQTGKVNLWSGSSQRSPGKVSRGCGMPLHAAMPMTTEESQTNITEKKKIKKGKGKKPHPCSPILEKIRAQWKARKITARILPALDTCSPGAQTDKASVLVPANGEGAGMADGPQHHPSPELEAGATGAGGGGGTPRHLPPIIITVAAEPGGEGGRQRKGERRRAAAQPSRKP